MKPTKAQRIAWASYIGKLSYKARLKRMGIERIREIARKNGKKGGRPRKSPQV